MIYTYACVHVYTHTCVPVFNALSVCRVLYLYISLYTSVCMFMLPICAHQRVRLCIRISFVIISILCYIINIYVHIYIFLHGVCVNVRVDTRAHDRAYVSVISISKCLCTRITYM